MINFYKTGEDGLTSIESAENGCWISVTAPTQEEIEYLSTICDQIDRMYLRLPIFVSTDITGEETCWKVDGRIECKIIAKVLDRAWHDEETIRIFPSDYRVLLKRLPTTTAILYL